MLLLVVNQLIVETTRATIRESRDYSSFENVVLKPRGGSWLLLKPSPDNQNYVWTHAHTIALQDLYIICYIIRNEMK